MKKLIATGACLLVCVALFAHAEEASAAKLKGLWCTGGGSHDYKKHAPLLTEKTAQLAAVEWTVVFGLDVFKDADYAEGYDVVAYDLCYAGERSKEIIGNVTNTIKAGKPTVIVHCSLHTFRAIDWDNWREAMGMTSSSHDRFRALGTKKTAEHPTTKFWPENWQTTGDELYRTTKLWPSATALLTVFSPESKKDHVVCWINQYGKGRVWATTLGHNMQTVGKPEYHRLLANGVLWVCGKLDDNGKPLAGYEGSGN